MLIRMLTAIVASQSQSTTRAFVRYLDLNLCNLGFTAKRFMSMLFEYPLARFVVMTISAQAPQDSRLQLITLVGEQEGWCLVAASTDNHANMSIERDDEQGVFFSNDAAIEFVRRLAESGSRVHQMALAIHSRDDQIRDVVRVRANFVVDLMPNGIDPSDLVDGLLKKISELLNSPEPAGHPGVVGIRHNISITSE
jgi:hypothetical protein